MPALQFGFDFGHRGGHAGADHLFNLFGELREVVARRGRSIRGCTQRRDVHLFAQARRADGVRRFDQPRRRWPVAFVATGHVSG